MDEPLFIEKPLSNSVMKTIPFLLKDKCVKEAAAAQGLSPLTVEGHTKQLREGMECSTIYGALVRLIALDRISPEQLVACLPAGWERYRLS